MSVATAAHPAALRRARLAQVLTLAWMTVEAVVALGAGFLAGSVALVAFGADSLIELFTAGTVLRRLGTGSTGEAEVAAEGRRERSASRIVAWALYALVAYIVLSSAWTLIRGAHPEPSRPGLVLAAAAVLIMPWLWRWRLRLSEQLHSSALRADAACSAVCLYMAAALLGGMVLNNLLGWWWADPVAALAMTWWIQREAREALEAARTGVHCADCAPEMAKHPG